VTAAPSRLLGPSLSYPSSSRRTPGPRDHRALDGNQKGIEPPQPPRHGGCFLSRAPKHCAGGTLTALRSIPVAAAPLRLLGLSLSYPSSSRRTPGPRDHRALDGNQKDIEPPQPPRHGGCFLSRAPKHRAGGISTALRSIPVTAAPSRLLGPRFRGGNEGRARRNRKNAEGPIWRRTLSSSSQRTPGPRDHRALDGNQEDIEPPQPPRHGGYFLSRALKHRAGGKLTALRSAP